MNLFPINSQTSEADRSVLLALREFVAQRVNPYGYIEVGSFLGGSLTPFLLDERCRSVFSIDDRGQAAMPDERGIRLDYKAITGQTMLDNLQAHSVPTTKLRTHDLSIETLRGAPERYELGFIDGEHTDTACFRDFVHLLPMMKDNSVVMFHDSTLVYKGLQIIKIYGEKHIANFRLYKSKVSEMSVALLGRYAQENAAGIIGEIEDFSEFCARAEDLKLLTLLHNRVQPETTFKLKPMNTFRAY